MTAKKPAAAKVATSGRGVHLKLSDEEYAQAIKAQKAYLRQAADRIERGESLDEVQIKFVALVLRGAADRLSDKQPRKPGQAPQVDHGSIAMSYAAMVGHQGIGKTKAIDALAEHFEVSVTTVKTALRKYGTEAVRITGGPFIQR